jgi:hypothetical protein
MKKFDLKKAILENKATFFSSLNEGQFSWMTQDTNRQIGSERENTIDVYMFDDKGNKWYEPNYEGYGEFGGKDYYELLDQMNGGSGDRSRGINLSFDKIKTDSEVLYPALVTRYNYDWKSHDFTEEAENDPNQSWYAGEEYGYRDYHDEELEEGDIKEKNNTNIYKVAEKFANYMSKKEGKKFTVNTDSVDEYSFDLDLDGKEYEGGSYLLKGDNIVNVAIPGNPSYAKINQFLEEGEAAYEYEKGKAAGEKIEKKKMKMSEFKAKIKEMVLAEMNLDVTDETSGYDFLAELEDILEAEEKEADAEEEIDITDEFSAEEPQSKGGINVNQNADADLTGVEKETQDNLEAALEAAKKLGDEKLATQIGNTLTFFTKQHVVK